MYTIKKIKNLQASFAIPADKSISHRALMLAAIARGKTRIKPFLDCDDTRATIRCIKRLGVGVKLIGKTVLSVEGNGKYFIPKRVPLVLCASESGTTMRMLAGLLCGQRFVTHFKSQDALAKRPMRRIIEPLKSMGAKISGRKSDDNFYPPLAVQPSSCGLTGIAYAMPVASAQVKSAILFASLYAKGKTVVSEPSKSRDHTERMMRFFHLDVQENDRSVKFFCGQEPVSPQEIFVPSDFSSAAFFIVLGLLLENSTITLKRININSTRTALIGVLQRMGANIQITNQNAAYEPYADIIVKSSALQATKVSPEEIPAMIDEVQILCVAAAFAKGETLISGVQELRVKETDRIHSISYNLKAAGASINQAEDTLIVKGPTNFKKANFKSFGDHRTAMSAIILGSVIGGGCTLDETKCINKSFSRFISLLKAV